MADEPLVSVGIPTYNRPAGLRRTLDCITTQTYRNLEIIISDNASPDPEVERVAREFQERDTRIQYFRQNENNGAGFNFLFVKENARGEFFMWAADDDVWENFYIEKLANFLEMSSKNEFVAVNFEAQYMDENGKQFEFFPEGAPFYNYQATSPFERLQHMLKFNYGNIIYSLYRRNALTKDGLIFAQNEIPFLLQIIRQGNWKVLPETGFYKKIRLSSYTRARWEMEGGSLDVVATEKGLIRRIRQFASRLTYHECAIKNILQAINTLEISRYHRARLKLLAQQIIWKHLIQLSLGYKRRPSA